MAEMRRMQVQRRMNDRAGSASPIHPTTLVTKTVPRFLSHYQVCKNLAVTITDPSISLGLLLYDVSLTGCEVATSVDRPPKSRGRLMVSFDIPHFES